MGSLLDNGIAGMRRSSDYDHSGMFSAFLWEIDHRRYEIRGVVDMTKYLTLHADTVNKIHGQRTFHGWTDMKIDELEILLEELKGHTVMIFSWYARLGLTLLRFKVLMQLVSNVKDVACVEFLQGGNCKMSHKCFKKWLPTGLKRVSSATQEALLEENLLLMVTCGSRKSNEHALGIWKVAARQAKSVQIITRYLTSIVLLPAPCRLSLLGSSKQGYELPAT